jgi:hypothetical protein
MRTASTSFKKLGYQWVSDSTYAPSLLRQSHATLSERVWDCLAS